MPGRTRFTPKQRVLFSRLTQRIHRHQPILRGSLVTMARTCGKVNCKCQAGEKHVSLYLSASWDGKRKMIYIPRDREEDIRAWVESGRQMDVLLRELSHAFLEDFLNEKAKTRNRKS